jgi:hypothetical protein
MSDLPQRKRPQSFLSPKYWLAPYAISVSTLYLWGYWGSFHINVLELVDLTDIIKAAVYPVLLAFAFPAIGILLGHVFSPIRDLPPGGGAGTRLGKFLHRRWVISSLIALWVMVMIFLLLAETLEKWRILPFLFATPVCILLKSAGLLADEFKSEADRLIVVYLLAFLPVFAYGQGVWDANDILIGSKYMYAVSDLPGQPTIVGTESNSLPRYVGRVNDRYVFFQPTNRGISFIAVDEVKALVLNWHERSNAIPVKLPNANASASSPAAISPISHQALQHQPAIREDAHKFHRTTCGAGYSVASLFTQNHSPPSNIHLHRIPMQFHQLAP